MEVRAPGDEASAYLSLGMKTTLGATGLPVGYRSFVSPETRPFDLSPGCHPTDPTGPGGGALAGAVSRPDHSAPRGGAWQARYLSAGFEPRWGSWLGGLLAAPSDVPLHDIVLQQDTNCQGAPGNPTGPTWLLREESP